MNRDERFEIEALPQWRALFRTACRLTRNVHDAEDLVQDTLLRAYRAFDRFEPGTNLRAWLYTILHRVHLDGIRRAARTPSRAELPEEGLPVPAAQEAVAAGGLDLARALDRLPEPFKTAVVLRDLEELRYDEIARVTEVPIGTVMSRIHRGRKLLRETMRGSDA
ncbi:MAG TPA: sigma-70 family RNA polymerase sigma factor [Vicinamibacteria bacterium]|nr:sigma-70 family RNA polymerase sigma factor [Vicinamibacteria bacterium]